ncbi:hypothetical protein MMC16_007679 [Acarospora aff. strigata]|nr:hypothetical protein [Acarospora aff. strigata]
MSAEDRQSIVLDLDLVAVQNAVEAIISFGRVAESAMENVPGLNPDQVASLRRSEWTAIVPKLLAQAEIIKSAHERWEKLQSQLSEAKQALEQQRQRIVTDVASQYTAGIADIHKELQSTFATTQQQSLRSNEAALDSKVKALEAEYLAKEARLEALHSQTSQTREAELRKRESELETAYKAKVARLEALQNEMEHARDAAHQKRETELEAAYNVKVADLEALQTNVEHARDAAHRERVSDLEASYQAKEERLVQEREQAYQARVEVLEQRYQKREVELEAEFRRQESDLNSANVRHRDALVEEAQRAIVARQSELADKENQLLLHQVVIDAAQDGLLEQNAKIVGEGIQVGVERAALANTREKAMRVIRQAQEDFSTMLAEQRQGLTEVSRAHSEEATSLLGKLKELRQEFATSQVTLQGLQARCETLNQESRQHEIASRHAQERANELRIACHTKNAELARFSAEVQQQKRTNEEEEQAMEERRMVLEVEIGKCASDTRLTVEKEKILRNVLEQLSHVRSATPEADPVVDRLFEVVERLETLRDISEVRQQPEPSPEPVQSHAWLKRRRVDDDGEQPGLGSVELGSPLGDMIVKRVRFAPETFTTGRSEPAGGSREALAGGFPRTPGIVEDEEEEEPEPEKEAKPIAEEPPTQAISSTYNKIQFPDDGSWSAELDSWFRNLLNRDAAPNRVEQATLKGADQPSLCFRNALISKKRPTWGKAQSSVPQGRLCDTCRSCKQPACVYFQLCDEVAAEQAGYPTNARGKRWVLSLRLD